MSVTWTLELTCQSCRANVVWESEIPRIEKDRSNIILNNKAKKFLESHPTYDPELNTPATIHRHPIYAYYTMTELPEKYTLCPVCLERIYFE